MPPRLAGESADTPRTPAAAEPRHQPGFRHRIGTRVAGAAIAAERIADMPSTPESTRPTSGRAEPDQQADPEGRRRPPAGARCSYRDQVADLLQGGRADATHVLEFVDDANGPFSVR